MRWKSDACFTGAQMRVLYHKSFSPPVHTDTNPPFIPLELSFSAILKGWKTIGTLTQYTHTRMHTHTKHMLLEHKQNIFAGLFKASESEQVLITVQNACPYAVIM